LFNTQACCLRSSHAGAVVDVRPAEEVFDAEVDVTFGSSGSVSWDADGKLIGFVE
jgi:hypothetical protein